MYTHAHINILLRLLKTSALQQCFFALDYLNAIQLSSVAVCYVMLILISV